MLRRDFLKRCAATAALAIGSQSLLAVEAADAAPDPAPSRRKQPYFLGADISWLLEDEAQGATYWDRGVRMDLLDILKKYDFNSIRARLFVDPAAQGGYSRQGFCDLEHTKILAKRIKAAGMQFLLDFHYADTWTSPGHQNKPAAWAGYSVEQLTNAVYDWTQTALKALKENGTPPQLVQIGNETTDGILFPEGRMSDFDSFARFVNAGCRGARDFDPTIKVAVHNHLGRDNEAIRRWVDNFLERKTDFDIIGMSCYSEAQPGNFKSNFNDIAVRYPHLSFMALEYSRNKRYLNDLIFNAPNEKGLGSFIWEPTRWREAIFDKDGQNAGDDENRKPHSPSSTLLASGGIAPPATRPTVATLPASLPSTQSTTQPRQRRSRGGKYETNSHILTYPEMAKAYGLVT